MLSRLFSALFQALIDLKDVVVRPRKGLHNIVEAEVIWPSIVWTLASIVYIAIGRWTISFPYFIGFTMRVPAIPTLHIVIRLTDLVIIAVLFSAIHLTARGLKGKGNLHSLASIYGYVVMPLILGRLLATFAESVSSARRFLPVSYHGGVTWMWYVIMFGAGMCIAWSFILCTDATEAVYLFSRKKAITVGITFLLGLGLLRAALLLLVQTGLQF